MACGTNGMCAGNSSYEALCHGICEIMERYVSKEILFRQPTLPDISFEEVKDSKTIELINLLKKPGMDVIIKDCTLGGIYPVVGVLLLNKSKTRYQFRLGSEAVFSIALERCFTEIFQGGNIQEFISKRMLPIEYNFTSDDKHLKDNLMKISRNGTGQFPISIFFSEKSDVVYRNGFLMELESNEHGYEHLLKLLKQNRFKLFIRNLSFLGFPTYKIYIPGMSEVFLGDTNKIEKKIRINRASNLLLNIQNCNKEELIFLLEELDNYCINNSSNFYLESSPYFKSMNLHLEKSNELEKIDLRVIVALLSYIVGNDKTAAKYFVWYMKSLPERNYRNLNYYRCIMVFLQLVAEKQEDWDIQEKLVDFFPEKIVKEVLDDFKERSVALFSEISIPSCPDCTNCKIAKSCLWEKWEKVNNAISEKLNIFNDFAVI